VETNREAERKSRKEESLRDRKREVYTEYLRSVDASYAQADAGYHTRSEDEKLSTAVAEIELLCGPTTSGRVRRHSMTVIHVHNEVASVHDKPNNSPEKSAVRDKVREADKVRKKLICLFKEDLGI
jgi:hypothetical protein